MEYDLAIKNGYYIMIIHCNKKMFITKDQAHKKMNKNCKFKVIDVTWCIG